MGKKNNQIFLFWLIPKTLGNAPKKNFNPVFSDEALLEDEALATSNYAGTQMEIDLIARRNLRGFCLHGHYLGNFLKLFFLNISV